MHCLVIKRQHYSNQTFDLFYNQWYNGITKIIESTCHYQHFVHHGLIVLPHPSQTAAGSQWEMVPQGTMVSQRLLRAHVTVSILSTMVSPSDILLRQVVGGKWPPNIPKRCLIQPKTRSENN